MTPHNTHEAWKRYIETVCEAKGLSREDAEECVSEVLLRYTIRRGALPWEEERPEPALIDLLTRDVAHERLRCLHRRQRLHETYERLQQSFQVLPTPEDVAISSAEVETFRKQLPEYLLRTLDLLVDGYTPREVANLLKVSVGTVYAYRAELREKFIEYFGYDPRNSRTRIGNYIGCAKQRSSFDSEEAYDETSSDGLRADCTHSDCAAAHDELSLSNEYARNRGGG